MAQKGQRKILIVEEDLAILSDLKHLLAPYSEYLTVMDASDASEALKHLHHSQHDDRPDALVLDIMLPYGESAKVLNPDTDPRFRETGVRLLSLVRSGEINSGVNPLWVSVITARSDFAVKHEIRQLLGDNGKLYNKPFDTFIFEHDLMNVLHIPSQVPGALLPDHYQPPVSEGI